MKDASSSDSACPEVRKVLDSPIAGSWYTNDKAALRRELEGYLASASDAPSRSGRVVGLILPHAGYRYSGLVAAHGFRALQGQTIRRVVVLATSHRVGFSGLALTDATHWRTPLGEMGIDRDAVGQLAGVPLFAVRQDAFVQEHSLDIQVPFLQVVAPDAQLVPVVVGRLTAAQAVEAGRALRKLLDPHTVIVASSDFTHYGPNYGYVPFDTDQPARLKALADDAFRAIRDLDVTAFLSHQDQTDDTICGTAPISALLAAMPKSVDVTPLKFDTSGRITGDYTNSVSYFAIAFRAAPSRGEFRGIEVFDPSEQKFLLDLARETLRRHLAGKPPPDPEKEGYKVPDKTRQPYGVFVTLKMDGDLRGCIGSILPVEPLIKGVIRNAVNAASHDPRFDAMTLAEEPRVQIEISVLTPPKTVDGVEDIAIGRDGILIDRGGRRAVFLPQVAPEQNWDLETTLAHLSMKAGMPADAWRTNTTFQTFQAQVFHEMR